MGLGENFMCSNPVTSRINKHCAGVISTVMGWCLSILPNKSANEYLAFNTFITEKKRVANMNGISFDSLVKFVGWM